MSKIEDEWKRITQNIAKPVSESWWNQIVNTYNGPGRFAYNISYLQFKLLLLQELKPTILSNYSFMLALFFQYFHYNPRDTDFHTKNIESLEKFSKEAGISIDHELIREAKNLLEESWTCMTEEHKQEGRYGTRPIHYLLDVDVACLGNEPELYRQHAAAVSREYAHLPPPAYNKLRQKVLQSFILIPNIFATQEFRDKYEATARANIEQEIALMQ